MNNIANIISQNIIENSIKDISYTTCKECGRNVWQNNKHFCKIFVYARNWNILRYQNGIGGLQYYN